MLYVQKGLETKVVTPMNNSNDFEALLFANPTVITTESKTQTYITSSGRAETIAKGRICSYFFAGELTTNERLKENIVNKSLLVLDYDNDPKDPIDLETMKKAVHDGLAEYNYYLYPSTSYTKELPKIRVIVEPNRVMNEEELSDTTKTLAMLVGLPLDKTSGDYFRIFGLPCTDDEAEFNRVKVINRGLPFEVVSTRGVEKNDSFQPFTFGQEPTRRGRVVTQLERVIDGVGDGQRNTTLASVYGTLIKARMTPAKAMHLLWVLNKSYFNPSLDESEFASVMRSITKRAKRKEATMIEE